MHVFLFSYNTIRFACAANDGENGAGIQGYEATYDPLGA